jgi:glycosyltransferase involved in cell wall biosynthesis
MLSIIIPTHDSERPLVHTLAALVPGATAGLVREVIVADAQSSDGTEQVADITGCVFVSSGEPLGTRLNAAAERARGEWLMFLRPGIVPGPTWIDDVLELARHGDAGAAVFSQAGPGIFARLFTRRPHPDQGLILPKSLYAALGGHHADAPDPETDLLRRIGGSRITVLRTTITDI